MAEFEKYGFRDERISRRHRLYGKNVPAVDLDFLLVEYNFGKPCALVEYKHRRALGKVDTDHKSYEALSILASNSSIPFFIAFYYPEVWAYVIEPVNDEAFAFFGGKRIYTEREYVAELYRLRGMVPPKALKKSLNGTVPDNLKPFLAIMNEEARMFLESLGNAGETTSGGVSPRIDRRKAG